MWRMTCLCAALLSWGCTPAPQQMAMPDPAAVPADIYSLSAPGSFPASVRVYAESAASALRSDRRFRPEEYFARISLSLPDSVQVALWHHSEMESYRTSAPRTIARRLVLDERGSLIRLDTAVIGQ